MSYRAENYRKVRRELEDAKTRAEAESDRRTAEVRAAIPEIAEIDERLAATGRRIFAEAVRGGDDLCARIEKLKNENLALQEKRKAYLLRHGLPADYTETRYRCEKCKDTGYADGVMCDCMKKMLVLEGLRTSGLGSLIDKQSFDNFSLQYYGNDASRMQENSDVCRRFAEAFRPGDANLFLIGGTGLGKTHLSTAIARTVIEKGFDVLYETAPNVFSDFEYDRFRLRGDEKPHADRYLSCELLILDDLGAEMASPYTTVCLYNLINTRMNRGLSTVINSNLSEEALLSRYDDRIVSRIFGEYRVLLFTGNDIRLQKLRK